MKSRNNPNSSIFQFIQKLVSGLWIFLFCLPYGTGLWAQESIVNLKHDPKLVSSLYPLKDKSLIFTEDKIKLAREKIKTNQSYTLIADKIFESADRWIAWDEKDLMALIPDPGIPRAFDLNAFGCPVHGDTIFKVGGTYPWILDPRRPFKVECPIGHEIYPSNDFEKYVQSGYKIKEGWESQYVDIGWGWVAPRQGVADNDGKRYWFVAYANHWMIRDYVQTAIRDLGRAYVLSGKVVYARKAAVLLYRLSEVYPHLDYQNQSRMGLMQKVNAKKPYKGRMFNYIWETEFIRYAAECYDAIWPVIGRDSVLEKVMGLTGHEMRLSIERKLLEEAFQAYLNDQMVGNFGMHQLTLLYLMKSRQYVDTDFWIDRILNQTDEYYLKTGLNYALYNFIQQDGIPYESPAYNRFWVEMLTRLSAEMKTFGINLFTRDRMKSLTYGPLKMVIDQKFTPATGDSGSVVSGLVRGNPLTYLLAFRNYQDTALLRWAYGHPVENQKKDSDFEMLFIPDGPLSPPQHVSSDEENSENEESKSSTLFAGYGLAILRSPNENNALALSYGEHGAHFHWDFLNFELYANGQKMMPDLGYPDAMNSYVPGIFTWSQNTVSHNTVVIDAHRQDQNKPGRVHQFAVGPFVRFFEASSPAYKRSGLYRRHMVMVEVDSTYSYVVDFFRVKGGRRHDYSLHGPPGQVVIEEEEWSSPRTGTYAGQDVEWGEIYDNKVMGQPGYKGGYHSYEGSGFQYLFDVRQQKAGTSPVEFRHEKDPAARLRIYLLPDTSRQVFLSRAYDKPRARKYVLPYLISRSELKDASDTLKNTFMSVLEPYYRNPKINSVTELKVMGLSDQARAISVDRGAELDIVLSDTSQTIKSLSSPALRTDATTAVITIDREGGLQRVYFSGGSFLTIGDRSFRAQHITGKVTKVDYSNRKVIFVPDQQESRPDSVSVYFGMAYISSSSRNVVHPVASLEDQGNQISFTSGDDLIIGKLLTERQRDSSVLKNHSILIYPEKMPGSILLDSQYRMLGRIKKMEKNNGQGLLHLENTKEAYENFGRLRNEDVWVTDVAPGDQVKFKSMVSWQLDHR